MVESLCNCLSSVNLNNEPLSNNVVMLNLKFGQIYLTKEPFLQKLLRDVRSLPKISKHVRQNMDNDKAILQRRIDRERRRMRKLTKSTKMSIETNSTDTQNTENDEKESEDIGHYEEVYEESFLENEESNHFDIDDFNDE